MRGLSNPPSGRERPDYCRVERSRGTSTCWSPAGYRGSLPYKRDSVVTEASTSPRAHTRTHIQRTQYGYTRDHTRARVSRFPRRRQNRSRSLSHGHGRVTRRTKERVRYRATTQVAREKNAPPSQQYNTIPLTLTDAHARLHSESLTKQLTYSLRQRSCARRARALRISFG